MQPYRRNSILLAIGHILLAAVSTSASADTRYVDGTNNCGGNTPCDTTIQAAVDAATVPAEIKVYPGTYTESVTIRAVEGDISLQAVSASGSAVTSPTVTVNGDTSPALDAYQSEGSPEVEGNLTVNGFILQSTGANCLQAHVEGSVSLSQIIASNCPDNGLHVYLSGDGELTGQNISASDNEFDGMRVQLLPATGNETYEITLTDVELDNNGDDGIKIDDNPDSEEVASNPVTATIALTRVTATGNGDATDPFDLMGDGIEVRVTAASVSLEQVTANNNADDGLDIDQSPGSIDVQSSEANGNGDNGFDLDEPIDTVVIRDSEANDNGDDGLDVDGSSEGEPVLNVTVSDFVGNGNGTGYGDGVNVANAQSVTLSGVTTNRNTQDGIDIEGSYTVIIRDASSNNNADDGFEIDVLTSFQGSGNEATGNEVGFRLEADSSSENLGNVSLRDLIASANDYGIYISEAQPSSNIAITDSDITGNSVWGIGIDENSSLGPDADDSDNPSSPDAVVDARRNYWGAASGPTHPTNPSGSGDVVADGENDLGAEAGGPNSGTINFGSFRSDSINTALPVPALGGLGLLLLSILTAALGARRRNRV